MSLSPYDAALPRPYQVSAVPPEELNATRRVQLALVAVYRRKHSETTEVT